MEKQEYVEKLVKEKYEEYDLKIPYEKLPWSGDLIETKLNDGTVELVDRMVEFTLCALHSYYYIDRYGWTVPSQGGPIPFKLRSYQKEALNDYQTNSKVIFRKCRQMGCSVITGCYALWRANFQPSQSIKVISLTREDAQEFKEKTIDINYRRMPGFLKTMTRGQTRISRSKLELNNDSTIKVLSKSKNAGRGGTPSLVIIDEAAFNEFMPDIWKSIAASLESGGDCIVISTTNGVGNWYHTTWSNAVKGKNEFLPIFIPWWKAPGRSNPWLDDILSGVIPEKEVDAFVKKKQEEALNYEGDIKDAPWLFKQRSNAETEKDFEQEYLAKFHGTGSTVVPQKYIDQVSETVEPPVWEDVLPQDPLTTPLPGLHLWEDVKPSSQYALTADVARGDGADFSAFQVIDVYNNMQVGEYDATISTKDYGGVIKRVARYFNNAYVIIECNALGIAVFNEVYLHETDPYQNVFAKRKGKTIIGWETTSKTRNLMVDDLFHYLVNSKITIKSQRFIDELEVFNWNDKGKAEALSGFNDDLIISMSLYCHLKDFVLSSRPLPISNGRGQTAAFDVDFAKWAELDDRYMDICGSDYGEYCWMQGKEVPAEYKEYKKNH